MKEGKQRWQRLKEIVIEALERPESERLAYLNEVCGDDEELRGEAASLVQLEGDAEGFIEGSPVCLTGARLLEGDPLGPYRVLRMLGAGGMGEVYLAERADGAFEQDVAIKVIRASGLLGELVERFLSERQLLAEMKHPNIAHLIDGGTTDDGRPYLVMEHVEGEPIDVHCEDHGLSIEARLRLFLRVCDAVQHAHRHLVVHRDLKPANILVTRAGEPKLLDFGVAKDLSGGKTPATRLLVPVSPEYASPEQLMGGSVTTAVDVYALGVVLYELLAGQNPFGKSEDPLAGRSNAAPPTRPSSRVRGRVGTSTRLSRQLTGDLDHIVLRALEPDPAKRYPSVEQMARDIDWHLRGLALETRGGVLYRLGKLARRHWKALAVVAVMLTLGSCLVDETLERREIEQESRRLERETQRVTQMSYDLSDYLIQIFLQADPGRTGERNETLERMLDHGVALLDAGAFAEEPIPRAALLGTTGQVYRRLGRLKKAEPLLRDSLDIRRDLPQDHVLTGLACNNLAVVLRGLGEFIEARALLLEAKRIYGLRRPDGDPISAAILNNLAGVEKELGNFEDAIEHYRAALAMKRRLAGDFSPRDIVTAVKNLGTGQRAAGLFDEAEATFRDALRELSGLERPNPLVQAGVEHHLGSVLRERGDLVGARKLLEKVLGVRLGVQGAGHRQSVETLLELALVDQLEGRLGVAEERIRRVFELRREHQSSEHPDTGKVLVHLARLLVQRGELSDARAAAEEALGLFRSCLPTGHWRNTDVEQLLSEIQ